jgi:hypothetical protein
VRANLLPLVAAFAGLLSAQTCPDRVLGTNLGVGDDTMFPMQPIGFAFPFAGATWTDVHICANGYFFFSNGNVPPAPTAGDFSSSPLELGSQSPRIAPLWCDLNHTAANGAGIWIDNSTGTKCTITWDNAVNYGMTTRFQIQVQLFPTGEIRMFWSEGATNNSAYNYVAGVGLTGLSPGLGVVLPGSTDLSPGGTTASDTLYEAFATQGFFDLGLKSLQLIPLSPGWLWIATPWSGCATTTDYGSGCVNARDSFYEIMPASQWDLANATLSFVRNAGGYTVTAGGPGTLVAPSAAAVIVANGDDVVQTVALASPMPVPGGTTTALTISSNGNIALAATGNGGGFAPDVGNFLAFAQTSIAAAFHDYNPGLATSGKVLFEQAGGVAYVTWNGVFSYLTSNPDTFQYQFELATGNCTIVYGAMTTGSNDYLVGYSRGGPSWRPEESDVSAMATALVIADAGVPGLALTSSGLPTLGNAGFAWVVSNVPSLSPVAALFFGATALPGVDLTPNGLENCRGYTSADLTSVTFPVAHPAGVGSQPFALPATITLIGASVTAQAAALSPLTTLGAIVSNGNEIVLGL